MMLLILLIGTSLSAFLMVREYNTYSTNGRADDATTTDGGQMELFLDDPMVTSIGNEVSPIPPINTAKKIQDRTSDYSQEIRNADIQ